LHYLRAAEEFDFDPIILLQPWHHVKPDPIPNYISYPLDVDYSQLDDVSVELSVERIKDGVSISRIIRTPMGDLSDKIEQMRGGGIYGVDPTPVIKEPLLKGPEDLEKLPYLFPDPDRLDLGDIGEMIRMAGERGLVEVQIDSAVDQRAGDAYGLANLMMACYDDPDFVKRLLRICQDQTLRETKAVLEAGVQVVFVSWFYASLSAGWSPKLYRQLFSPLVKEHVDLVHSYDALYHYYDDGKCAAILDDVVASGADVISTLAPPPFGDVDLAEVKARVGNRICLKGNIDLLHVVKQGTPREIDEAVREAIVAAAPGGGYVLATSDAIRDGTPPENVKAFCEAGRRYGKYT
jgi:uroporphyrinogen decarboxylase